jgi:hypothetical protein
MGMARIERGMKMELQVPEFMDKEVGNNEWRVILRTLAERLCEEMNEREASQIGSQMEQAYPLIIDLLVERNEWLTQKLGAEQAEREAIERYTEELLRVNRELTGNQPPDVH